MSASIERFFSAVSAAGRRKGGAGVARNLDLLMHKAVTPQAGDVTAVRRRPQLLLPRTSAPGVRD
jgi:hypothetical protein